MPALYTLGEKLYEGKMRVVYRGEDASSGRRVIVKQLRPEAAGTDELRRLRREREILEILDDPGIARLVHYEEQGVDAWLVIEDIGGESIARRLTRGKLPIREAVHVACGVARALTSVHAAQIVHKDVGPNNIGIAPDGRVQLFDFDLAAHLPRSIGGVSPPNQVEGTLHYIAPEQTGRVNLPVDERSDLYSLGATLYEMLVGRPPFRGEDALEIVHGHLALRPIPPSQIDPKIPQVLTTIVLTLLEKAPEDRYQSAFGVMKDLEMCLASMGEEPEGDIAMFPIATYDVPARLHLPRRIYGREEELRRLVAGFDACRDHPPTLAVVAGAPGVGKSTIVEALAAHVAGAQGFFGSGKLEADRPDAPYTAFLDPLRALAQQIFSAGESEIDRLKTHVAQTVGTAPGPLIDLLPELSFLWSDRAQEPTAGGISRDRVRMLFTDLLRALASPGRPITLVLDDAHWADQASLDLLGALAREKDIRGLLLVATTGDEGLAEGQPVAELLRVFKREGTDPLLLSLPPMPPSAIEHLLRDAMALSPEDARSLGALVWAKTSGNSLALGIFLSAAYHDGLLYFDGSLGRWAWDEPGLESLPVADNVVELLSEKTNAQSEPVRRVLGIAACLGGSFDPPLVAAVGEISDEEASELLDEAASEGLLVTFDGRFRFAHDRVLAAVYRSLSLDDLRVFHRAACAALASTIHRPEEDLRTFEVLRHAAVAGDVFDEEECLTLARLGLIAGRRSRATAAYEIAQAHFEAAIARLPSNVWRAAPDIAHDLHFAATECAYASERYADGDRLFQVLEQHAPTAVAKALAWGMRARGVGSRSPSSAIRYVRSGCALIGIKLPEKATLPVLLFELAKTNRVIKGRSAEELAELPELSNPEVEAALDVIGAGLVASQLTDSNMFAVLTLRGVALIAEHGNCAASADLYAFYAMTLGAALRNHGRMEELGRLALTFSHQYPDPIHACRAWLMNGVFFQHFRDHVRTSLPMLEAAQRLSLLAGDNSVLGLSAFFLAVLSFSSGQPIDDVLACCEAQMHFVEPMQGVDALASIAFMRQVLLALQNKTSKSGVLAAEDFDPDEHLQRVDREASLKTKIGVRYLLALSDLYFGRPRDALATLDEIHGDIDREWVCLVLLGEYWYLRALSLSSVLASGGHGLIERERYLLSLRLAVRKVAGWAERSPKNFTHKYALVSAELAGLTGDADTALRRYEEAIFGAQRDSFLHDLGIAYERTGEFFLERRMVDVAITYFSSARRAYMRWGAFAKVAMLDRRFPGLAGQDASKEHANIDARFRQTISTGQPATGVVSTVGTVGMLDAPAIVKVTQALSSERNMGRLFARVMEIVAESAGAERGALLLMEGERQAPRLMLHAEVIAGSQPVLFPEPKRLDEVTTLPAVIVRWVVRTGQRVLLNNAAGEGPFTQDPYIVSHRSRSILVMPLQWQGELLGVLALENNLVSGAFTERRAAMLTTLCVQLAISIQNARYFAELERKVDERTRALREAQSRIVALEKDATEVQMAGGFAHEMRNALAGARMLLQVALGAEDSEDGGLVAEANRRLRELYMRMNPLLPEDQAAGVREDVRELNSAQRQLNDVLLRVEEAVSRGLGITNNVLSYAALRREERGEVSVPLKPMAEVLVRDLETPGVTYHVDVPEDAVVRGKSEHVRSIIENLVRNARDAVVELGAQGQGWVRITATVAHAEVTLRVQDNGPGIPEEVVPRIFEPFFSTKPTSGIGLGLGVVQKLVSLYEGRISVDSVVGHGTCFTVTLPSARVMRLVSGQEEAIL